ncbi:hypothetical protein AYO49_03215 [Verrucomicrobiaceae bacterium SCGC AG-212-N21]|nr:hypothetical protein AYO49_03215 [Verrucomicrobiaceae bacterium SCGC AG-212-N21]
MATDYNYPPSEWELKMLHIDEEWQSLSPRLRVSLMRTLVRMREGVDMCDVLWDTPPPEVPKPLTRPETSPSRQPAS